jgi:modulator of FtsH protease
MSELTTNDPAVPRVSASAVDSRAVFSQTMGLVAVTSACFALGAYIGRHLTQGWGWFFFIGAFIALLAMRYAIPKAGSRAVGLLFVFGALIGLATAPTLAYYASASPGAVAEAGLATALTITALGGIGYGARRDLSGLGRVASWALVALVVFGIVAVLAQIPNGALVYAVAGLAVFSVLTVVDFQRLRLAGNGQSAPLLAASIFLDALNVFLFFLTIFDNER